MTPAYYPITISRGSPFSERLRFVQPDGDPVDLTGLTPMTWQVRDAPGKPLRLEGTTTDVDLEDGTIEMIATDEATAALSGCAGSQYDLLDFTGTKWMKGPVIIEGNITELP